MHLAKTFHGLQKRRTNFAYFTILLVILLAAKSRNARLLAAKSRFRIRDRVRVRVYIQFLMRFLQRAFLAQWVKAAYMVWAALVREPVQSLFYLCFFFTFFSKFFSSLKFFLVHNILLILKHISKIFKAKKAVEIVVTSQYTISLRAGGALTDLK